VRKDLTNGESYEGCLSPLVRYSGTQESENDRQGMGLDTYLATKAPYGPCILLKDFSGKDCLAEAPYGPCILLKEFPGKECLAGGERPLGNEGGHF